MPKSVTTNQNPVSDLPHLFSFSIKMHQTEIKASLELLSAQLLRNFTVREGIPNFHNNQRLNLFHFILEPINSTWHQRKQLLKACTLVWIKSRSNSGQASELGRHHTPHDPEQDPRFLPIVPYHLGSSSDPQQCPVAATAASNAQLAHHSYTF